MRQQLQQNNQRRNRGHNNMRIDAKKFYIVMIVATFLAFGGIVAAFYWGNGQLRARASKIADLQADNDIAQDKIIALKKTKDSASNVEDATKLLDTLLPATKQQEKLVADIIYTASQQVGIPLQKLGALSFNNSESPSDLSGTEPYKEVPGVYSYPFTMSVSEISYETLLKLLKEIELNGRLVQVDSLEISPDKDIPGQITNASFSLKAYMKP